MQDHGALQQEGTYRNSNKPDTVHLMKKIHFKIKEKSDAAINVDVNDAELGIKLVDDTAADTAGVASACAH
jgi:hypothetical protein